MQTFQRSKALAFAASALLLIPLSLSVAAQTSLAPLDLGALCERADKIFRGTVVDITTGTVVAGGSELPTITYRVRIDESFKGEFESAKGDVAEVELRMIGALKPAAPDGRVRRMPILQDMPRLEQGKDYLLFTTAPSAVGLSTTVGLGQGCFNVLSVDKGEFAVNEFGNAGLGLSSSGPVPYADLVDEIRARLGR